jgi:hypothetical protein
MRKQYGYLRISKMRDLAEGKPTPPEEPEITDSDFAIDDGEIVEFTINGIPFSVECETYEDVERLIVRAHVKAWSVHTGSLGASLAFFTHKSNVLGKSNG